MQGLYEEVSRSPFSHRPTYICPRSPPAQPYTQVKRPLAPENASLPSHLCRTRRLVQNHIASMKFFGAVAVFGLLATVAASPVADAAPAAVQEKRQYDAQIGVLTDLYDNSRSYTGSISTPCTALPCLTPKTYPASNTKCSCR